MMARRRRHRSGHKKSGLMRSLNRWVAPVTFGVAFVGQLTQKDIAAYPNFNALPNIEKGKFLANVVLGRTTSFNPFPQYGTPKFTVNPSGMINKYVGAGLGLMILSAVAGRELGHKSLMHKVGKNLVLGGALGGFFDANTGGRAASGGNTSVRSIGGGAAIGNTSIGGGIAGGTGSQFSGFSGTFTG